MKLLVKMQVAMQQIKNKKGQNTIEYLLMLGVIVGVVLAVGAAVNAFMPDLSAQVKEKILGSFSKM